MEHCNLCGLDFNSNQGMVLYLAKNDHIKNRGNRVSICTGCAAAGLESKVYTRVSPFAVERVGN